MSSCEGSGAEHHHVRGVVLNIIKVYGICLDETSSKYVLRVVLNIIKVCAGSGVEHIKVCDMCAACTKGE